MNYTILEIFFPLNELSVYIFKFISKLISRADQVTLQFSFPCRECSDSSSPGHLFRIGKHDRTDFSFSTRQAQDPKCEGGGQMVKFVAMDGHGLCGGMALIQPFG